MPNDDKAGPDKPGNDQPGNDNKVLPVVLLDEHRGMAAQKATDERRHSSAVEADQETLRRGREELEEVLFAGPARGWLDVAQRAAYLLKQYAGEPQQDPRYRRMISGVLDDLTRLSAEAPNSDTEKS
jgi:hypothetical protein